MIRGGVLVVIALVTACGYQPLERLSLCTQVPRPAECDVACTAGAATCPDGYHCGAAGSCDRACTPGGNECGAGAACTTDGRCEATSGPPVDGCPGVHVVAAPNIPTIELLIDQSGSMNDPHGNGLSRWQAVTASLVGPTTGVVTRLSQNAVIGATLYSADGPGCPRLTRQARARDNFAAIRGLLSSNQPINDTPTPNAIRAVIDDFAAHPPAQGSPPVIVLATDGLPDTCANPIPANATEQEEANRQTVVAAQLAFAQGIRLLYLFVGNAAVAGAHPQRMANAGAGQNVDTGTAPVFLANNPSQLTTAFEAIISGVLSCDIPTHQAVAPRDAERGTVYANGTPLRYRDDWTWALDPDGLTIRVVGAACDTLKHATTQNVEATFPCGS